MNMQVGLLSVIIVAFGVLSRLIPHIPNIVPIGALMLFGGAYLPKKLLFLPLLALFIIGGAFSSSVLFFLITNFGVWAPPNNWYLHTFEGLIQSYTLALPFFRNSLIGDLGYTILLFWRV